MSPVGRPAPQDYPVPSGIPTAVTLHELALLQRCAAEAGTVLEIGSLFGFSAIGMALAGAHVLSVDPHYDGPPDSPDTFQQFRANVERHKVRERILPITEPIENIGLWDDGINVTLHHLLTACEPKYYPFGMAFIDGNHTWPCPMRDARIALAHLVAPGYLAFHDVGSNYPGVVRTVQELEREFLGKKKKRGALVGREGTLYIYQVLSSSSGSPGDQPVRP